MQDETLPVHEIPGEVRLSRRGFLRGASLFLGASAASCYAGGALLAAPNGADKPALRLGLLTDVHHAEKAPVGTRYYREAVPKLREAVERFNGDKVDLALELGDFIDQAKSVAEEIAYLEVIEAEFARLRCERHYVLGNHCVATLTKKEFCQHSGARKPYYSFDAGGFHFIILDACFRKDHEAYGRNNFVWTDTNVPPEELKWVAEDLERTARKAIVFVHQRVDTTGLYAVKNAPAVREILEASGKVLAVFQGHQHINDHREIGRIHYVTLVAMVEGTGPENSAYAVLEIMRDGSMRLAGFRRQKNQDLGLPRKRMRV